MASSNKGRLALVGGADIFDADLIPDPSSPLAAIVADYYWGAGVTEAPTPVEILYAWISPPVKRRPAPVINTAAVSQVGGSTAYAQDAASITQFGVGPASVDLDTDCDADPFNLATFLVQYRKGLNPRQPILRLNLYNRTDAECMRILGVKLGDRVTIPDTPTGWPVGAISFTVEGIRHEASVKRRFVEWSCAALIGTLPPTPGPWWRWDASKWNSNADMRPF